MFTTTTPGSAPLHPIVWCRTAVVANCTAILARRRLLPCKWSLANNFSEDPNHTESRPQPSPHPSEDSTTIKKKDKSFRNPLTRSRSIRSDSTSKSRKPSGLYPPTPDQPPNSAPISADWPQNEMGFFSKSKGKEVRGKSADRAVTDESDENMPVQSRNMPKEPKEK